MKKIILIFLVLTGLGLGSCDMDKYPYNAIATDEALQSINDFTSVRNGCYYYTRYFFTGTYVLQPEIQCDAVHAFVDYSNVYGSIYVWNFTSGDVGQWQGFYQIINLTNLLIEKGESMMETFVPSEQITLKQYLGEAYFLRALAYEELAVRFCKAYNPSTANTDLGVSIVLTYSPSGQSSSYPARSTMAATYEQINSDLTKAASYLAVSQNSSIAYGTADAVTALKARVALQMQDYTTAATTAESLINSGKYPLVSTYDDMKKMWVNDESKETIFQPVMSKTELGNSNGQYLIDASGSGTKISPMFIPSKEILDLYDQVNDIRFPVYFKKESVTASTGETKLYICTKYPGNPALWTGSTNMTNMPKVLRIAEMYLIAAEAYSHTDATKASAMLNALKSKRIANYAGGAYTGARLTTEIREERQREFYMEGYRLWDLKRYGEGVKRGTPQNPDFVYLNGNSTTTNLVKEAGDFRFVWPIPHEECAANPQMQQNPGY